MTRESYGWQLYCHQLFKAKLDALESEVEELKSKLPKEDFIKHPEAKKLKILSETVIQKVPQDPASPNYRASNILKKHKDWRRVKNSPAPRYRLFFKFFKMKSSIFYGWFNDESCIRKAGDQRDVYKVFHALLESGKIPSDYSRLKNGSCDL
ncbi:MAG: type II toxin-antitoxin system YhaV family toxin [Desulfovibrionales bacterium]